MRSRRARPTLCSLAVLIALLGVSALGGCSNSSTPRRDDLLGIPIPAAVRVQARTVTGLGTILTDASGHVLYMFSPDAGQRVTCTGACAGTWPPLVIAGGDAATAGPGIATADLGTLPDPNTGARIVTYHRYPLYRYAGDLDPGTANGQGLFLNGGPWYVLNPDGNPVTTIPRSRS